ncbi:MAG: hypothetical protein A3J83_08205 [Elusimicrobia bacterium RIFOXYA2_FULL_40_6]|nr:MAG: hypothetical protein A3J83_08205 [Elusimicrobia bacterium RIFOXYA2_FULL_40_6]
MNETAIIHDGYSEIKRKLMHFLTLIYPVLYNTIPLKIVLSISGGLVVADIIVESFRFVYPSFNKFTLKVFHGYYRDEESKNISTLIWTFSGAFLTMFLFSNKNIVTASLLYMVFGDSLACLFGQRFGKIKTVGCKTLEGSFACFVVCFICGIFFLPWHLALLGALVATVMELLPLPLNDNFWVPVSSGLFLTLLSRLF